MVNAGLRRRVRTLAAEWWPARLAARAVARAVAPRHCVGVVGVVFDVNRRVLIVEHAFRTDFPWGLPGGWVERGEDPARTLARELNEELGLEVEVGGLVHAGVVDRVRTSTHPVHLGLAYACDLRSGSDRLSLEVLAFEWIDPHTYAGPLAPFQRDAVRHAVRLRTPAT